MKQWEWGVGREQGREKEMMRVKGEEEEGTRQR